MLEQVTTRQLPAAASASSHQITTTIGLSEQANNVVRALLELSRLPQGWDGRGGPSLREPAKASAFMLANALRFTLLPTTSVGPVVGGGIQFEWRVESRALEIEVLPDGSLEYLAVESADQMQEGEITGPSMLDGLFRWLMQC